MVASQFSRQQKNQHDKPLIQKEVQDKVSKIPLPIPPRPSAATLAKSKHNKSTKTFAQATKQNIKNLLKIKEAFSSLPSKKVIDMHSTVFNTNSQSYPKINMTTKGPSQKHVLIPMNKDNKNTILHQANVHVRIINNHLKTCRSDTSIDCIQET